MSSKQNEKKPDVDAKQTGKDQPAITEEERIENKIDRDLEDSFPASDPPGWTLGVGKHPPKK